MSKVISAAEAAKLIPDGAVVAVSGFGWSCFAEKVAAEVENRFKETGSPKNITIMHSAGVGNHQVGYALDHFAHEGLATRVISGIGTASPGMGEFINANKCQFYALPQGVVTQLYREIAGKRPGVITKIGLGTYVDPRVEGGKMNSITTEDYVEVINIKDEEYLLYKSFPINVALIRGTYADEKGNLCMDHEGTLMEVLPIAQAVRNSGGIVIAQVKDVVKAGSLNPKQVRVPGILIDHLVVSQPENHFQTEVTQYNPAFSGQIKVPVESVPPLPLDQRKVIARRAAMELVPNGVLNLGIGIPVGVGAVAAEEGVSNELMLTTEGGTIGGVPGSGGNFGHSYNAEAQVEHQSQFDFIDGGGLDLTVLGLAEADEQGNLNVSKFGPKVNGPGGFINIAQTAKKLIFAGTFTSGGLKVQVADGKLQILNEGRTKKFKKQVQQITFSGDYASKVGQFVLYVTERAVFQLIGGKMTLIEIAPGVDLNKDILAQMDFIPEISKNLKTMDEGLFSEKWGGLKEIIQAHAK